MHRTTLRGTDMSKTRPKWEVVFRALQRGLEINLHDGLIYALVDGELCHKLDMYTCLESLENQTPDEVWWVKSDMSLNTFIKLCNNIPADEFLSIGFSSAMKSMHNSPFNPTKWEES